MEDIMIAKKLFPIALLAALAGPAGAGTVEVRYLHGCTEASKADPSLVVHFSLPPGYGPEHCSNRNVLKTVYQVDDTRFGARWYAVQNGISISGQAFEPEPSDIAAGTTVTDCLTVGPNREYIDEWLVPAGSSCGNRGPSEGRHRRYYPNLTLCIIGPNNCVLRSMLSEVARQRFDAVYERAGVGIPTH